MRRRQTGDEIADCCEPAAPSIGQVVTFQHVPPDDKPVEREFPPGFDLSPRKPKQNKRKKQ